MCSPPSSTQSDQDAVARCCLLIEDLAKARLIAFPLSCQWIISWRQPRGFAARCADFAALPPDVRKVSDCLRPSDSN
jgi:hypothetical protein